MQQTKDRPLLQVGDFVKAELNGQEFFVSVKERFGNYAVLSNGIRFHVLDDRYQSKEQWLDQSTGHLIRLQ